MPEQYFFTTDADSWWLRFRLSGYEDDHTESQATEATLGTRTLGEYGNSGGDTQSFSVTTKASEGVGGWNDGGKAYYDSDAGVVDVPLTMLTARMLVGERLFIRLIAHSGATETLIARAELAVTQDSSREQASVGAVIVCDDDEYLSFRVGDSDSIEKAYAGPRLMSGGSVYPYQFQYKPTSSGSWISSQATYYDALTGLIDAAIGSIVSAAEPGDAFDYKVTPQGSNEPAVQGVMTYSPDCGPAEQPPDPAKRYDLTANDNSLHLRFRLTNFDPDPSQAVVTSVSIGRAPEPITSGEGVFYLRYKIDQSQLWRQKKTFFDDDAGVVEVNVRSILDAAQSSVEYRLVYRG